LLDTVQLPKPPSTPSRNKSDSNDIQALTKNDIDLISERFEVGGCVNFDHFMKFFHDLMEHDALIAAGGRVGAEDRPIVSLNASPFRLSSEWNNLKNSARLSHSKSNTDVDMKPMPVPMRKQPSITGAKKLPLPSSEKDPDLAPLPVKETPKPIPLDTPKEQPPPKPIPPAEFEGTNTRYI
jgi:hypothetical protein